MGTLLMHAFFVLILPSGVGHPGAQAEAGLARARGRGLRRGLEPRRREGCVWW